MSQSPLPDLGSLPRVQRRCLGIVSDVCDVAHAARKLHWSQGVLMAVLSDIQANLGAQHVQVADGRVQVSEALKQVMMHQRPTSRPPAVT